MRQFVLLVLTAVYIFGLFAPFNTYVGYCLNKEYITDNLCENQAKPELNCEGKCYLMDQLAEQATESADPKVPNKTNEKSFSMHTFTPIVTLQLKTNVVHLVYQHINGFTTRSTQLSIYNPPEFIA